VLGPSDLPDGAVDLPYSQQLTSDSSAGALWDLVGGELPPGLEVDPQSGILAGMPTRAGDYQFTLRATDATAFYRQGEATYMVTILERLEVKLNLPPARVDEPYNGSISATGGVAPYVVEVEGLLPGIALDPNTGQVSGTPTKVTTGSLWNITVTDSGTPQQTVATAAAFVVRAPPVRIATESLPDVVVGSSYSQFLQATDGVPPYRWAVAKGSSLEPLGLELVLATGQIRNRLDPRTGQPIPIPATATETSFTIQVSDTDVPPTTATKEFTIRVVPADQ